MNGPALRLVPGPLQLAFDPRTQVPLGEAGTFMERVAWSSEDGASLTAPAGALVSPEWTWLQVPLGQVGLQPGVLTAPLTVEGGGWTLRLPPGWRLEPRGPGLDARPPAPP